VRKLIKKRKVQWGPYVRKGWRKEERVETSLKVRVDLSSGGKKWGSKKKEKPYRTTTGVKWAEKERKNEHPQKKKKKSENLNTDTVFSRTRENSWGVPLHITVNSHVGSHYGNGEREKFLIDFGGDK